MHQAAQLQKQRKLQHMEVRGIEAPTWVYTGTLLAPWLSASATICCAVAIHFAYATKFNTLQDRYWAYASEVGIGVELLVLEVMRAAVTTIVELRKFEIRRRLDRGDFNRSAIRRAAGDDGEPVPKQLQPPKMPAAKMPTAPKVPPPSKNGMPRPAFLPPPGTAMPPGGPPPGVPPLRAGGRSLPVAAGPPRGPGGTMTPPMAGTFIPLSGRTQTSGAMGTKEGGSLLPGAMTSGGGSRTPPLQQSFGSNSGFQMPAPPSGPPGSQPAPPMMPGTPGGLGAAAEARMRQNKVAHATPPGSKGVTPPNSRPPSHRSGGAGPPTPPIPPPAGTLQQTRANRRAEQAGAR